MRSGSDPITGLVRVEVSDTVRDLPATKKMTADYSFIQGIAFLRSISQGYNFCTVECIKDFRTKYNNSKTLKSIRKCINLCHSRNPRVTQLNLDNTFGCIDEEIRPIRLNTVAAGEHVGRVEHSNRNVQEGTGRLINKNLYKRYPRDAVEGCYEIS